MVITFEDQLQYFKQAFEAWTLADSPMMSIFWLHQVEQAEKNLIQQVQDLRDEIARLREAARWIPMKERVQTDNGVYIGWTGSFYLGFSISERSAIIPDIIISWKLLPASPEVE